MPSCSTDFFCLYHYYHYELKNNWNYVQLTNYNSDERDWSHWWLAWKCPGYEIYCVATLIGPLERKPEELYRIEAFLREVNNFSYSFLFIWQALPHTISITLILVGSPSTIEWFSTVWKQFIFDLSTLSERFWANRIPSVFSVVLLGTGVIRTRNMLAWKRYWPTHYVIFVNVIPPILPEWFALRSLMGMQIVGSGHDARSEYLIESRGRSFVSGLMFSQSPILYRKISFIDWLKISSGQMSASCS